MQKVIFFVVSADDVFGPEKLIIDECHYLQKKGWNPWIINLWRTSDIPFVRKIEQARIAYVQIVSYKRFDLSAIKTIRKLVTEKKCALIHSNGYKSDLYCFLAARQLHIPLVTTIHGWTSEDLKVRIYEKLQAFLWRYYDRVFAVSNDYKEKAIAKGVPKDKIHVVYNGIVPDSIGHLKNENMSAVKQELGLAPDTVVVAIVGRLSIEKGHSFFLDAAKRLMEKIPSLSNQVHFVIVGDGLEKQRLIAKANELKLENRVLFTGHVDNVLRLMKAVDILAICSMREGLPITLLEAMLSRIPVLSVAVGGIVEVLSPHKGGLLVDRKLEPFVESLEKLVQDSELRQELGNSGYARVMEAFTFDHRMNSIMLHYKAVMT